jgi:flavin-dependent dehydrogenase
MRNDFDVIIVGGRCAGAATALLLARAGVRVLVIDKGTYGSDTLSTHALMRGAVMQLHRWGVLPRIVRAGTPPVTSTLFGYRTGEVTVAIEPRYGVDALYAPRRTVLDRALADEAALDGAELSYSTSLVDLVRDAAGRVRGVTVASPRGTRTIRAGLVVGADGLHSSVARSVAAATALTGRHMAANLYSYWSDLAVRGYEWHYEADASVGAIPTNDGLVCVFVSIPHHALRDVARPTPTAGYEHFLRTRFPAFAERIASARRVEPVRGFGGHTGFLKNAAGDGWALVGDAGYFKDPLTAHGITDALRDAELLARAALGGSAEAFADYDWTRHDLSRRLFEVTDRIASFTWTDEELQALHREFSREMSREQRVLDTLEPLACLSSPVSAPHAV